MHSSHTFLGSVEKCTVFGCITDFDDFGTGKQLHDETRCDDWRNTKFHQRSLHQQTFTVFISSKNNYNTAKKHPNEFLMLLIEKN